MEEQKKEILNEFYSRMLNKGSTKDQIHINLSELENKYEKQAINECIADELIKRVTIDPDPSLNITDDGINFLKD